MRIGDRYRYKDNLNDVWEIVGFAEDGESVFTCVDKGLSPYTIGAERVWNTNSDVWEYLGNFSKSENYTNLYEILKG